MPLDVFLLVLFSAFIQASWNFLAKRSKSNRIVLMLVGWFATGGVFLPICFFVNDLSKLTLDLVPQIAVACVIHTVYVSLLGWGYSKGDISVVYPVARGLGIAGTAIVGAFLGATPLAIQGVIGISSITGGTFLIGLKEGMTRESRTAFLIAIGIGLCVTMYSTLDSYLVKKVPPFFYLTMINLVPAIFAAPILFTKYRADVRSILRFHKFESTYVAFGGAGAYLLILLAYQKTQTAYVVALRESSVVVATGLGVYFLKEHLYRRKIAAVILIILGVVTIKLV